MILLKHETQILLNWQDNIPEYSILCEKFYVAMEEVVKGLQIKFGWRKPNIDEGKNADKDIVKRELFTEKLLVVQIIDIVGSESKNVYFQIQYLIFLGFEKEILQVGTLLSDKVFFQGFKSFDE